VGVTANRPSSSRVSRPSAAQVRISLPVVIGQPQVGGGPHHLADPGAVDHAEQRHRRPVAEALVLLAAGLPGLSHVGLSHDR
jgi:hypothetical protein